jgi:DNA polymerase-3 subunit epsilon
LEADLARHGLSSLAGRVGGAIKPVIDPLVIDRAVDRYRKGKRTLSDLMNVYGIAESEALHDAAADVRAAIAVFDAIMATYPVVAGKSLADLHAWQRSEHRKWATRLNEFFASKGRAADVDLTWP